MFKLTPYADAGKSSIDNLSGVAAQGLQGAQQLVALNLQATKAVLEDLAAATQAALSVRTPAELGKLQAAALQAAPQKALAYGRQVKEIFAAATVGQQSAMHAQLADAQAKFLEAVQATLKNAPGSENTLTLFKAAVASANNAFEGANKASKQVSDAVEANVAKITQAAMATSGNTLAAIDE
jgi:phasin family protein